MPLLYVCMERTYRFGTSEKNGLVHLRIKLGEIISGSCFHTYVYMVWIVNVKNKV
jgi:hypothetical protein